MLVLRALAGRSALHCNDVFAVCREGAKQSLLFFPGDIQNEHAHMRAGQWQKYSSYSYEGTLDILSSSFPDANLFLIKPSCQLPSAHSVYANFLSYHDAYGGLLLEPGWETGASTPVEDMTTREQISGLMQSLQQELAAKHSFMLPQLPLVLMGFSKGCLVLNHLLLEEEHDTAPSDAGASTSGALFSVELIQRLIWVDAGNSELPCSYPPATCAPVVHRFIDRWTLSMATAGPRQIAVHTTPFMVQLRPLTCEEAQQFLALLLQRQWPSLSVMMTAHYNAAETSMDKHFEVLKRVR